MFFLRRCVSASKSKFLQKRMSVPGAPCGTGGVVPGCPVGLVNVVMHPPAHHQAVRTNSTFEVIKAISMADVQQFANLTGDTNPIHTLPDGQTTGAVVHGALLMGYVSGAIGANCPGAVVTQIEKMRFVTPCPVGTTVKVKIEFVELRKITECNFACKDLANEDVIYMSGSAKLRIKRPTTTT